jgi:hypothetical protein
MVFRLFGQAEKLNSVAVKVRPANGLADLDSGFIKNIDAFNKKMVITMC